MGKLTDDMTRLKGEIDALRGARGGLVQDLTRGAKDLAAEVSAMQAGFAAAHIAMAKKTSGEREAFMVAMTHEVNSLLDEYSRNRKIMSRKGRHDRETFLTEMRRQVTGLCNETANDLMGARHAWRGESPGKSRPVPMKKEAVVVKAILPLVETPLQKMVEVPEIKTEKPPVTFMKPLKKEEAKKTVAAPEPPAVETPKGKAPPFVSTSMPFQKSKEKNSQDKKSH